MSVRRPRPSVRARRASALTAAVLALGLVLTGCGEETGDSSAAVGEDPTEVSSPTGSASSTASGGPTTSPDDPASSTSAPPTAEPVVYPSCVKVWVDGRRLPQAYDGCDKAGTLVRPDGRYCEFGMPLLSFGDHFYAVPGGIIHRTRGPLKQDPGYQRAVKLCRG